MSVVEFGEGVVKCPHNESGKNRCGVRLDAPVGKKSGTVGGHTYFECEKKHGVLVLPSKCTLLE